MLTGDQKLRKLNWTKLSRKCLKNLHSLLFLTQWTVGVCVWGLGDFGPRKRAIQGRYCGCCLHRCVIDDCPVVQCLHVWSHWRIHCPRFHSSAGFQRRSLNLHTGHCNCLKWNQLKVFGGYLESNYQSRVTLTVAKRGWVSMQTLCRYGKTWLTVKTLVARSELNC